MSRLTMRVAGLAVMMILVVAGLLFNIPTPKTNIDGNDAMSRAIDHANAGRVEQAYKEYKTAYDIFNEQKNARGVFMTSYRMGNIDLDRNANRAALDHYNNALRFAQLLSYSAAQIDLFIKQGDLKLKMNRVDAARADYYNAINISREAKNQEQEAYAFTSVGNLERSIGNNRRAGFLYRNALKIYEENVGLKSEVRLRWHMASLATELENYDDALNSYVIARELFRTASNTFNEATVVAQMARLENKRGATELANAYYKEAEDLFSSIGDLKALESLREEKNARSL